MHGTSLKAELEVHTRARDEVVAGIRSEGAKNDPLGLRAVVVQARDDAHDLGVKLGAVVTAEWMLRKMRALLESPDQSFASFLEEITAEVQEAVRL